MTEHSIPTWEYLAKQLIWDKLSFVNDKMVLDYGSGYGITANHLAKNNCVFAIEPSREMIAKRIQEYSYTQINGSLNKLKLLKDETFDVVICHCVLEYIEDKVEILNEFKRILKSDGYLSIIKHNRAGRVMQMVVLLNNFEHANELLDGENGNSLQYGEIRYYDDEDILKWIDGLTLITLTGLRNFWYLQQNQEIQNNLEWQKKILAIEKRVSTIKEYIDIAFFHHLIYKNT